MTKGLRECVTALEYDISNDGYRVCWSDGSAHSFPRHPALAACFRMWTAVREATEEAANEAALDELRERESERTRRETKP